MQMREKLEDLARRRNPQPRRAGGQLEDQQRNPGYMREQMLSAARDAIERQKDKTT